MVICRLPRSAVSARELAALVSLDQRERWRRGQRPAAEEYLRRFPQLLSDEELALDVIYSEFLLREELGQEPKPLEYQMRFPEFAETLQDQIEFHQAMAAANGSSRLSALDTRRSASATQQTSAAGERLPAHLTHFVPGYEILSELGRGGMGIVYRARQLSLNRLVALKMLRAGDCGSAALLARFQAEAEAVARLHHPNIVQIYDYGEHDGMPYLALELVDGSSLATTPGGNSRTAREAAEIVVTLARAVQFAHEQGIVHRDLKPANVLVAAPAKGAPGRTTIKITDFGLAKVFREGEESHTQTGTIVGTPSYMAPEQARGQAALVGPATDVYALGAILYELLTGQPPFKAATAIETLHQVLTTEAVSPARHQPRLPRDLVTIVTRCLQKEPRLRYGTAAELAEDLDRFLSDRPVRARRTSAAERGWRWCRRNPALALLFTSVAVLLVAVAAVSSISSIRLSAQLQRTQQAEDAQRTAKQTAQLRLWDAYLAEISAQTAGRHLGRRFAALETSERASALLDQIGRTPERELALRSATIAALALPDLRRLRQIDARLAFDLGCALAANRYVIALTAGDLSLCDLDARELVHIEHRGAEPTPVISPDGRYIGVSDLACAKVWRIDGEQAELIWQEKGASRLALAPDCRHAAVVGADRLMHWLDLTTGQKVRQLGHGSGRSAFSFHESSRRIAVMGDRGVQIIDWETGDILAELPASPAAPSEFANLAWHPRGEFIAGSYDDEGVVLWHVSSGRRVLAFPHMGVVRVCFVGSGDYLLTVNVWDFRLRMWHTGTGQEVLSDPTFPGFRSELMPDGRQLLLAANAEGVSLWEVESAQVCTSLPHRLTPSTGWRKNASISPDGRWLLVSGSRGLELWDLRAAQLAGWLESGFANGVFASDGSIVARYASGVFRWPLHRQPSEGGDQARFGPPEKLYGNTTEVNFAMSPDALHARRSLPRRLASDNAHDAGNAGADCSGIRSTDRGAEQGCGLAGYRKLERPGSHRVFPEHRRAPCSPAHGATCLSGFQSRQPLARDDPRRRTGLECGGLETRCGSSRSGRHSQRAGHCVFTRQQRAGGQPAHGRDTPGRSSHGGRLGRLESSRQKRRLLPRIQPRSVPAGHRAAPREPGGERVEPRRTPRRVGPPRTRLAALRLAAYRSGVRQQRCGQSAGRIVRSR